MSVYRVTEFTSPDMGKTKEFAESLREDIAVAGAIFIDVVSMGENKGLVIAKYENQAAMEAAIKAAKKAFGKMIEAGVVDGASINAQTGDVVITY
ncbi:MAG: hypothetical protein AAF530_17385 [Pseudomonadota bacterium]